LFSNKCDGGNTSIFSGLCTQKITGQSTGYGCQPKIGEDNQTHDSSQHLF
jgi:hypothetical protein